MKKENETTKRELDALILFSSSDPRTPLRDVINNRTISGFRIGRRCVGSKRMWVDGELSDVPVYKENRFVIDFSDGLSLNVSKSIFNHYRGHKKVEYFGFYE